MPIDSNIDKTYTYMDIKLDTPLATMTGGGQYVVDEFLVSNVKFFCMMNNSGSMSIYYLDTVSTPFSYDYTFFLPSAIAGGSGVGSALQFTTLFESSTGENTDQYMVVDFGAHLTSLSQIRIYGDDRSGRFWQ